ncbi:MAG: ABC transporter ATP-binding protein [Nitrospirae bacterium]|nr:ABC transporter ATP-binding protein [Nitrospirota bacterium]
MGIIAKKIGKVIGVPPTRVLTDITLEIKSGEFVALTGRSGSGKSTLLYLLSSLDGASEGLIEIDGIEISRMDKLALNRFRNEKIGFVFQFHYLIAELSALENTLLPARKTKQESKKKNYAESLLDQFGLGNKLNRFPRQLSGGEQQRVAIARSLVMEPRFLFADEPTGSLDSINGRLVIDILREVNRKSGTTILMVTHDQAYASLANRQIQLADGRMI